MAHLESLVVLDPSPRTRSALAFGFERAGYAVYATAESADALAMAQTRVPQLVVASMQGQGVDAASNGEAHEALSLVGRLREESATRELPIVVLGERGAREPALRAGADEFVARPAFIRDVLTLARLAVALRQDGDDSGVAGLLEDYGLYFLTRALAVAGRTGVVELERGRRTGEVRLVQGEVVAARSGRMSGVAAFQHLLLWGEASMQLRFETPAGERKIHLPIDELLASGAAFAREFEALSQRIGGVQAVFRQEPRRAAEARAQIPGEVMGLLKHYDGKRPFIDVVEDSAFKPLDTIKITYRLQQLGVIERVEETGSDGAPLTAQLAVRDWLLGAQQAEAQRSTVTEAGRRAAEAYAEAAARKDAPPAAAPEDEILDDTQKIRTAAGAAAEAAPRAPADDVPTAPREADRGPQARNKKRKRREDDARRSNGPVKHDTAPTLKSEESPPRAEPAGGLAQLFADAPHDTAPTPKIDPQPAAPARVDDDATIPFTKLPFDIAEAVKADLAGATAPVAAKPQPQAPAKPPAQSHDSQQPHAQPHAHAPSHVQPTQPQAPAHAQPPSHAQPTQPHAPAQPHGSSPQAPSHAPSPQAPSHAQPHAHAPSHVQPTQPQAPAHAPSQPHGSSPQAQPHAPSPHAPSQALHAPHSPSHTPQGQPHAPSAQASHTPQGQPHAPSAQAPSHAPAKSQPHAPSTPQEHAKPQAHAPSKPQAGAKPQGKGQPQARSAKPQAPAAQLHKSSGPTPKLTEPKNATRRGDHTGRHLQVDPKDPAFSEFEEEFFASAAELATIHPVENFDDLEPKRAPPKRRWFGFGSKLDSSPKSPKKR